MCVCVCALEKKVALLNSRGKKSLANTAVCVHLVPAVSRRMAVEWERRDALCTYLWIILANFVDESWANKCYDNIYTDSMIKNPFAQQTTGRRKLPLLHQVILLSLLLQCLPCNLKRGKIPGRHVRSTRCHSTSFLLSSKDIKHSHFSLFFQKDIVLMMALHKNDNEHPLKIYAFIKH